MQTATEEAGRTAAATIEAVMQKEKDELAAWYDAELLKIQTELDKEVKKRKAWRSGFSVMTGAAIVGITFALLK